MSASAQPPDILRTVIVGEEFAATLVAAALAENQDLKQRPVQVLVLPPAVGDPVWQADAALPWHGLPRIRKLLDADSAVAAGGAFSWGIALTGWAGTGHSGFLPFGSVGAPFGPIGFQHIVQRLRQGGARLRFANYALAALAAQTGRFERPGNDPRSVLSTADYGLHLDLSGQATRLRQRAESRGVRFGKCAEVSAQRNGQGRCQALTTESGQRIEAEFFIDCSRRRALAPDTHAGCGWIDWSAWFPADRMLSCHAPAGEAPEPFSEDRAISGGWLRRVPLPGRVAITACFASQHQDDTYLHVGLRELAGAAVSDVRIMHARMGRLEQPWQGNIVAVGPAAASIEPLTVSPLQLLVVGVERLLELLPAGREDMRAEASEFNRRLGGYVDRARDLSIAAYWLNGRQGEPYWDAARNVAVPDSLAAKLALFTGRGQTALYDDEPVEQWGWISLFDELGVRPGTCSPLADGVPPEQLAAHADKARALMLAAVARMPMHGAYLAQIRTRHRESSSK